MNTWLLISSLLFSGSNSAALWLTGTAAPQAEGDAQTLALVMRCRSESSPLLRLDCYDKALASASGEMVSQIQAGPAWQRAMEQEKGRTDHSTAFLVSLGEGANPQVVLTTPAIGVPPPRPVLMFSCIDNITRLQVALAGPQKSGAVTLIADRDRFDVQWFLRENGYLLESSRGLAGIDEIKRLMSAQTLTIDGAGSGFPRLTFNISQLSQTLKPLRNACHW
ncbi:type VI secretion system protein VasI [Serratia fonticola]|jgi:type VI secretion system protein VasI|uniref:Type VI secretion system protein VasI n=1 Tax=Serratia fonticola TaxID=47917 RepID=A0A559TCW2_SERFO|nr:type VI secretion system-associated protein VasI [Serratia fonticola]TQI80060.1 type VI secretion system protein VasI [Serratia fonticola]TQI97914.1 type VI secretion system protein VasI [Serratia fonticola]TVZ72410.1 type VI secretion system protein VasI [Serratia fonticola]